MNVLAGVRYVFLWKDGVIVRTIARVILTDVLYETTSSSYLLKQQFRSEWQYNSAEFDNVLSVQAYDNIINSVSFYSKIKSGTNGKPKKFDFYSNFLFYFIYLFFQVIYGVDRSYRVLRRQRQRQLHRCLPPRSTHPTTCESAVRSYSTRFYAERSACRNASRSDSATTWQRRVKFKCLVSTSETSSVVPIYAEWCSKN